MEKQHEKTLDKVRKFLSKNQYDKADVLLLKALETSPDSQELLGARLYISLKYKSWQASLTQIKQNLRIAPFQVVFNPDNTKLLFQSFKSHSAFKIALFEYLLNHQYYSVILFILDQIDEEQRELLSKAWQHAAEDISDNQDSANWYLAAGIAHFKLGDLEGFFSSWKKAVSASPNVLPGLIAFCQRTKLIDLEGVEERMFLIELFLHSDNVPKGLALMKVMGAESKEYARLLLQRFNAVQLEEAHHAELVILKTRLGIMAEDFAHLSKIQGEWQILDSDQLFQVQKSISQGVIDLKKRKKLLLSIVQAYFHREDWENSAQLLETMEKEDKDPEIIALMEYLLDRYPIIPHLHVKVGDFQLERGLIEQAIKHYRMVLEVPKYRNACIQKLERAFLSGNSPLIAKHLVDFLPTGNARIALVGLYLYLSNQDLDGLSWFPEHLLEKKPTVDLDPIWYIFLTLCSFEMGAYEQAATHILGMLEHWPDLCHEIIPLIEANCGHLNKAIIPLVSTIQRQLKELSHQSEWERIIRLLEKSSSISQNLEHSDFFKTLHRIEAMFQKGDFSTGFPMVQRMAARYDDAIDEILKFLDGYKDKVPDSFEWVESKLGILLRGERNKELIDFAKTHLVDSRFRSKVATLHQFMGWAYQAEGDFRHAIEHFCYGALEKKWFSKNLDFFKEHVFTMFPEHIPNVLTLLNQNGDDVAAMELAELWHQHRQQDLGKIHHFFEEFAVKHPTPRSRSALILWAIHNREFERARDIMKNMDPREPQYGLYLPNIIQVFKLKQPQDPTARFLLGRYYLYQGETSRAVDLFRNLIQDLPHTLQDVFSYLKKSLKKGVCKTETHLIYGLLIRISLDQKLFREAIAMLKDFGNEDQQKASSFVEGVFKMLRTEPKEKQAFFEFIQLNAEWGDYDFVCTLEDSGILTEEMFEERLEWLKVAASQPGLKFRATALQARILFSIRKFEACRALLLSELGDAYSCGRNSELLEISMQLLARFPEDWVLKRLVAFSLWRNDRHFEAQPLLTELLGSEDVTVCLEAFALYKEIGGQPSFFDLLDHTKLDENQALLELGHIHERIRSMQLELVFQYGQNPREGLCFWLLECGRLDDFDRVMKDHADSFDQESQTLLKAFGQRARGRVNQAAVRVGHSSSSYPVKKQFFLEASMEEAALLLNPPDEADLELKKRLFAIYGQPRCLELHLSHLAFLKGGSANA